MPTCCHSPSVQATLDAHNAARTARGAAALVWNDTLATYAQGVSQTCKFEVSTGKCLRLPPACTAWVVATSQLIPHSPSAEVQPLWHKCCTHTCASTPLALQHSNGPWGENLAMGVATCKEAVSGLPAGATL